MSFKSGFVTIIGRPNVGKSTLLNALTGQKIAITSNKPQTTRHTIKAIITDEHSQIIFTDTPGIHKPKNKLGQYMVSSITDSLNEIDVVLYLVESTDVKHSGGDIHIIEQLKKVKADVFLLINKIDLVAKETLLPLIESYSSLINFKSIIPISAKKNKGLDLIIAEIKKSLPTGPKYYAADLFTDQTERKLVEELIREKILILIDEEIPHGIGVEIISFKQRENKDLIDIKVNIYCEKDSHKAILIGAQGSMLKKIGAFARSDIETLLDCKVFLELWVKVKKGWRNNDLVLDTLGYKKKK